mmetsp:Transcript_52451/g.127006  ORF Transcript_52451/g.127006 Transcript_52451/m.127006 type:complete len:229 (+) Transcript_52451:540-1226(+)
MLLRVLQQPDHNFARRLPQLRPRSMELIGPVFTHRALHGGDHHLANGGTVDRLCSILEVPECHPHDLLLHTCRVPVKRHQGREHLRELDAEHLAGLWKLGLEVGRHGKKSVVHHAAQSLFAHVVVGQVPTLGHYGGIHLRILEHNRHALLQPSPQPFPRGADVNRHLVAQNIGYGLSDGFGEGRHHTCADALAAMHRREHPEFLMQRERVVDGRHHLVEHSGKYLTLL